MSVYCKMPLAGVRECNVEERIMNIVHSVTGTQWSILKCYKQCRVWVACTKMLVFIPPPVGESLGVFPIGRIRLGSEKACHSSACVYRNLPCRINSIKLYCIFLDFSFR